MKRVSALLGTVLFAVGVVVIFVPEQLPPAAISVFMDQFGDSDIGDLIRLLLIGTAAVSIFVAIFGKLSDRSQPVGPVQVPDQRQPDRTAAKEGWEFDRELEGYDVYGRTGNRLEPVSEPGLQETLVRTVARTEGISIKEAQELIRDGEWTDNRQAALLFADSIELTPREHLRTWLRPEAAFRKRVAAAVEELDGRSGQLTPASKSGRSRRQHGGKSR